MAKVTHHSHEPNMILNGLTPNLETGLKTSAMPRQQKGRAKARPISNSIQ